METPRIDRAERIARIVSGPAAAVVVLIIALGAFGWFMDHRLIEAARSQQEMIDTCAATSDLIRDQLMNTPEQP